MEIQNLHIYHPKSLNVILVLQNKYVLSMQLHFPISLINFFLNNINIFGFLGDLIFNHHSNI
jgi:hypothetical protein